MEQMAIKRVTDLFGVFWIIRKKQNSGMIAEFLSQFWVGKPIPIPLMYCDKGSSVLLCGTPDDTVVK